MNARSVSNRLSYIKSNTAQFTEANPEAMEASDGICDACGQYDTEITDHGRYGFCRQRDCEVVREYVDARLGFRIVGKDGIVLVRTEEALAISVPKYQEAFENIRKGLGLK